MGVTSSGIRYPEGTEPTNAGATNMKNLADDVTARYGRGLLARTVGVLVDVVSSATIMSTVVTMPAQRWVRIYVALSATQITAATATSNATIIANGANVNRILAGAISTGQGIKANGEAYYLAAAGTLTASLSITGITAGALRVEAGETFLVVEDAGGPSFVTTAGDPAAELLPTQED